MNDSTRNLVSLIAETTHKLGASCSNDSQGSSADIPRRQHPIHGFIFQLKLLMLFLHRGLIHQYSFFIGTEIKEAKKFDDLVFQYEQDGLKIFRLLQAKHKLDKLKNKITEVSLLTEYDGDFNLPKYFFSYRAVKKEKLFSNGVIKDITICTNIDFSEDIRNGLNIKLNKIEDKDDILDIKIGNEIRPIRYRLHGECFHLLEPRIKEYVEKTKRTLPKYSDDDIKDFLNRLVFAVNCPNEEELGIIIKSDIGKEFDFITTDNLYNEFFVKMMNWLQGKGGGRFLSFKEGIDIFDKAIRGVPLWFNIRSLVESFTGRDKELMILHNLLLNRKESTSHVCITGIGGVGKSELARMYIRYKHQNYDGKVAWITAENYKTLSECFYRLASELGITITTVDGKDKNISTIVCEVYRFLSSRKSLFIFDNAKYYQTQEKLDNGLDRFLPSLNPCSNVPFILITSRNQKWPYNIKLLKLNVFEKYEALELISKGLGSGTDESKALAKELHYFPLALQQAIAYIKVQDTKLKCLGLEYSISRYISTFREKAEILLNFKFPEDCDNYYSHTILTTWNISLATIEEKEYGTYAIDILRIISFLEADDIPTEVFLILVSDVDILSTAFDLLQQFSMISIEGTFIYVHSLVQQTLRLQLQEQKREVEFIKKALNLFCGCKLSIRTLNHAITLWNFASTHEESSQLAHNISFTLLECGKYEEAYSYGRKAASSLMNLSRNDPMIFETILKVKSNIGVALLHMREYDKALKTFTELLPDFESTYGQEHHLTLMIKSNIAVVYHGQGNYNKALIAYQEILTLRKIVLGENHSHTLMTKQHIAKIFFLDGNEHKASQLFQEILKIQESILGADHPETLDTKLSIAVLTQSKGHYNESLQILQEIHDIQKTLLEKSHPKLLHTKSCMGVLLIYLGKINEAMDIFQEILAVRKLFLGENHSDVHKTLYYIANLLLEQGRYNKAFEILEEIYEKQLHLMGPIHPDTVDTQYSKGNILYDLGKYNDALQIHQNVLKNRIAFLGQDHYDTLRVRRSIADSFLELGNTNEAFDQYLQVLQLQENRLGENHVEVLETKYGIGRTLVCKHEFDKAVKIFLEVLENLHDKMFQPDHPSVLSVKLSLADLYSIQNKHGEALKVCEEVLECQEIILGKSHFDIAKTKFIIGTITYREGKTDEAFKVLSTVSAIFNDVLGPDHPKTFKLNDILNAILKSSPSHTKQLPE